MGWNFRKSIKVGPARINLSKSGVGYSVGAKGFRFTKRAGSKKKEKTSVFGVFLKLVGIAFALFFVLAIAAAIYTFVLRFKWVFLALAILAAVGLIAYFVIKNRNNHPTVDAEGTSDPVS